MVELTCDPPRFLIDDANALGVAVAYERELDTIVAPCDVLLIVPPFSGLERPSLAMHVLQACARDAGFSTSVFYANLSYAQWIGEQGYLSVCAMPPGWFIGERLFSRLAYDLPPLGNDRGQHVADELRRLKHQGSIGGPPLVLRELHAMEATAERWLRWLAPALLSTLPAVVGCTSSFEQTAAGIALLRALKQQRPDVLTVIGGANCEDAMGEGMAALSPYLDVVFSGESERAFVDVLNGLRAGCRPTQRIVKGEPCMDLDALPTPDFSEYYHQLDTFLPASSLKTKGKIFLPYETSRGCWWGQKSHCTFCGISSESMGFRKKSPDRVIADLRSLSASHPTDIVAMADNIMPQAYYQTLLPRLKAELPPLFIFYELKANMGLRHMRLLHEAGVREIQPGIEALSTGLLKLMAKGVTASQNIATLRHARALGTYVQWNLLWGFPNDELAHYEETLALLPLIRHLRPPRAFYPIVLDRFAPYFTRPGGFGIANLTPLAGYADVFPAGAAIDKLAYYFSGTFRSGSRDNPAVVAAIAHEVAAWRAAWYGGRQAPPQLNVTRDGDRFLLEDTRTSGVEGRLETMDREQAVTALLSRPGYSMDPDIRRWALERKVAIDLDGGLVPLATASLDVLATLEDDGGGSASLADRHRGVVAASMPP